MPSLSAALSKLSLKKHRRSTSQSSTPPNSSPRQSLDTRGSPSTPTKSRMRDFQDVVVVDREGGSPQGREAAVYQSLADERDDTGHSAPFADESSRPDLPTTTSNVNNPKPLPSVPKSSDFPSPPKTVPNSSSAPRLPELPVIPALPHVSSIDRAAYNHHDEQRPRPIVSSSQAIDEEQQAQVGGKFRHVDSSLHSGAAPSPLKKDHRVIDGLDSIASGEKTRGQAEVGSSPSGPVHDLAKKWETIRSTRSDQDIDPAKHLQHHLRHMAVLPTPARHNFKGFAKFDKSDGRSLLEARNDLVSQVVAETSERKRLRGGLSEAGQRHFKAGGIGHLIGAESTVDVYTTELEPVIQEHIIRREHTEYFTIIEREIHKYHIYPKIQPIYDPDPIMLPPRHRIFSSLTGEWHEVIGDAAAIELLGEEVFRNGPKEVRMVRANVVPGYEVGGKVQEREGVEGGKMGPWHEGVRGGWKHEVGEKTVGVAI